MEKMITVIPSILKLKGKLRVAAYARVSTRKDAMLHSLSAQVSYYNKLIQNNSEWLYVGVYVDESITGTKEDRTEFLRMIKDAREGKIDLIITKSISRFARNTVILLQTVRELKSLEVDVYFEEQNIHTLSSDGELMMTILASYAQEESRSASENQKWRVKRNFEKGIPCSGKILGYRYERGKFVIVPEEAMVVKRIFEDYLSGMGCGLIARTLNEQGITTRDGYSWPETTVRSILRNYNYTGNLLLQKTYRENHVTKKKVMNLGEHPMYHAKDTHEAIIDLDTFNKVQDEIKKRYKIRTKESSIRTYTFSGILVCDNCGKHYRRKTTPYKIVWICSTYNKLGKSYCDSKQVPEDVLIELTTDVIDRIKQIRVCDNNILILQFKDGRAEPITWDNRRRSK